MAVSQKPIIGVKDVVYAILTEASDVAGGTPLYGTIYSLPNVTQMGYNPNSASATLFADDGAAFSDETVGTIDVTLNFADILPADEARLLGHTYSNGQILRTTDDVSPYVAVGFKITMASGVYKYVWLYKGRFLKPQIDVTTKNDSINYQLAALAGKFVKRNADSAYQNNLRTDDDNATAYIATFFDSVVTPSADATALTATIAEGTGGSAGSIEITFAKGSGASFSIDADTVTAATLPIIDDNGAGIIAGSYAVGSAGTTVVVTFTPTSAWSSTDVVGTVVTNGIKDSGGVGATATGAIVTIA